MYSVNYHFLGDYLANKLVYSDTLIVLFRTAGFIQDSVEFTDSGESIFDKTNFVSG